MKRTTKIAILSVLMMIPVGLLKAQTTKAYDIIVYGATSAGVTASLQAARMNKSVLLIAQDNHLGGMTSSGLGATDINRHNSIGGFARDFYSRIYDHYLDSANWTNQSRSAYFDSITKRVFTGKDDKGKLQWVFEPKVALQVFKDMLEKSGVTVVFNSPLNLKKGVIKKGNQIKNIQTKTGNYTASVFIDTSYEGDLMAMSKVEYIVGREPNKAHNETYNGIRPGKIVGNGKLSINPYIVEGDKKSGLLPYIESIKKFKQGKGDHRLQAYCYRFTLTTDPKNRLPIVKPADYQPLWYEYIARKIQITKNPKLQAFLTLTPMPNKKTDTNHADFIGANYSWPEGDYLEREKLAAMHKSYTLGMIWFYANDPRVPEHMRTEMKNYGLARDEFKDSENFPPQIYVREARRMISDYVMTEHNYYKREVVKDAVGLGTYWLDSHVVSNILDTDGSVRMEGNFWENKSFIYPISYRSIVPKNKECGNLLVPVCLSATHSIYGSIRMEPVYMVLGQSAGAAAALSIDQKCDVQDLDYNVLQQELLKAKQILAH